MALSTLKFKYALLANSLKLIRLYVRINDKEESDLMDVTVVNKLTPLNTLTTDKYTFLL